MSKPESIRVKVNVKNPGQFFACCGLLELAHRLWQGSEGWFEDDWFVIAPMKETNNSFAQLIEVLHDTSLSSDDNEMDHKTCPLRLGSPFDLRLDWWLDETGGDRLKTWAGQQSILRIAPAMKQAFPSTCSAEEFYQTSLIITDPTNRRKSVEPFYFDARRFAHALDVGFSLDVQGAETLAHPTVELLCLIGLQRFRPSATIEKWSFEYYLWSVPLSAPIAAAVVCGEILGGMGLRFQLRFRDNQKRYKAFSFAIPYRR